MTFGEKLLNIDRRIIFLIVALAVALPFVFDLKMPIFIVTPEVQGVFDPIQALPENAGVLMVFDYEPAATPELDPMAKALLRQCFSRNLRVVCVTTYSSAPGLIERQLKEVGDEYNKLPGIDYTSLGYRAGAYIVIINLTNSVKETFPVDYYKQKTTGLPVLEGLDKMVDFGYLMVIHDDASIQNWVTYGFEQTGIPTGSGCTAVMATGSYPLLNAGQITGILGGLKGAAEYEKLMNYKGVAHQGMFSQSVVHVLVILLIILGNIGNYLMYKTGKIKRSRIAPGGLKP